MKKDIPTKIVSILSTCRDEIVHDFKRQKTKNTNRRKFIRTLTFSLVSLITPGLVVADEKMEKVKAWILGEDYKPAEHYWGMGIDINKCIGCGRCADACKKENDVPEEPFFFRTWVERYQIFEDGSTHVDSPNGAINGFSSKNNSDKKMVRSFFCAKDL